MRNYHVYFTAIICPFVCLSVTLCVMYVRSDCLEPSSDCLEPSSDCLEPKVSFLNYRRSSYEMT